MKKIIVAIFAIVMAICAFVLSACNSGAPNTFTLYVPDGATAMAVATLIDDNTIDGHKVNVVISNAQEVQAKVLSGEADMAILPTNNSANLYNKGIEYSLVTVNVSGLLYLVGEQPTQLEELVGQVVYSIGKGSTPEYVFKKILQDNGIQYTEGDTATQNKVTIKYLSSAGEILPLIASDKAQYALLGEPAVTQALTKFNNLQIIADLQQLWSQSTGIEGGYPQAGVIVSNDIIKTNVQFVTALIERLQGNKQFLLDNLQTLSQLFQKGGSQSLATTQFTKELIERCNLDVYNASQAHNSLVEYFEVLLDFNAQSVGNKLPDDGYYYGYEG